MGRQIFMRNRNWKHISWGFGHKFPLLPRLFKLLSFSQLSLHKLYYYICKVFFFSFLVWFMFFLFNLIFHSFLFIDDFNELTNKHFLANLRYVCLVQLIVFERNWICCNLMDFQGQACDGYNSFLSMWCNDYDMDLWQNIRIWIWYFLCILIHIFITVTLF